MKTKTLLTLFLSLSVQVMLACPVCEKYQPKITQGFTHGAGPQSNWDWVIIGVMTVITILVFAYSLKYIIRPGEKNSDHIKQSILSNP